FAQNTINKKIGLFDWSGNDHQFYGFGVNAYQLRYQVDGVGSNHVFWAATSATTSNELMRITGNGKVGIGTNTPSWTLDVAGTGYFNGNLGVGANPTLNAQYRLVVGGTIAATNYAVVAAFAADYVFENDYKLITLSETEAYIKANKHLPAFKSAKHYEAHGYTMTEMNIALEQTVEELTLHAIAQEKEINAMKSELAAIKAMLLAKKL
ncbi:hypothetical protein ACNQGB_20270, partial [Flavobacterium sp. XS1P32]